MVKMNKLDLHSMNYLDARKAVISFVEERWNKDVDCKIITGHSIEMRRVVKEVLDEYNLDYQVGGYLKTNPAVIMVTI
jgi:DNA-nicking Smr family endonuclease